MSEEFFRSLSPIAGTASPSESGQKMLQKFREQRAKKAAENSGLGVQSSGVKDIDAPGYFDAVADGSHIATVFSEKKGRERSAHRAKGPGKKLFDDPLEADDAESGNGRSSSARFNQSGVMEDSFVNTPNTAGYASGGSALRSAHKGYMNMLDHEEETTQHYYEAFNELKLQLDAVSDERDQLASQVDQLTDERDSLSSVCNNLGERLKALGGDYDEKLSRLAKEKEDMKLKYQGQLDAALRDQQEAVEIATLLEAQVKQTTEAYAVEARLRKQAEDEKEEFVRKCKHLEESARLIESLSSNTDEQLRDFRIMEKELRAQIEVLEKNLATERRRRLEDAETAKATSTLQERIESLTNELAGNKEIMKVLESRVEQAENLNSDYSRRLIELASSNDELSRTNIDLESKNELLQTRMIQLQRDMLDSPRGKSSTNSPTRSKKSSGKALDPNQEREKALLDAQLLLQHFQADNQEKDKTIAKAAEVARINAAEIEELVEENRQLRELLENQGTASTREAEEASVQLQIELSKEKKHSDNLASEVSRLKSELVSAKAPALPPPPASPSSARMQDFLLGESSPKRREDGIEDLKAELQRTVDSLIEANDDRNELRDKLTAAEGALQDATKEKEMLSARVNAKTEEIFKLREEKESLEADIKRMLADVQPLKLTAAEAKAEVQRRDITNKELRAENEQLQDQIADLQRSLEDKEAEVAEEMVISENMRQCLVAKFGEEESVGSEIQAARDALAEQSNQIEQLQSELNDLRQSAKLREQGLEAQLSDKEAEVCGLKDKLQTVAGDVHSSMQDLRSRLDHIGAEKDEMVAALQANKEKCLGLEHELREKNRELQTVLKDFGRVVESVQFYKNRLDLQTDSLSKQTAMWFDSFDNRVRSIHSTLRTKQAAVRAYRKEFDHRLEEALQSLTHAMDSNDILLEERNQFEDELKASIIERDRLEKLLEEEKLGAQLQQQDISRESAQLAAGELSRLMERLEQAERRAVEMSTNGAKAFAKSARTIAYLEGECHHQVSLVDHLRGVNAKLASDLKLVTEEALHTKGLEHRLNMAAENEAALLTRIATLENGVKAKEKELLLTLHSSQSQEEIRTEKFDAEVRDLGEKLKAAKDRVQALSRELKNQADQFEARLTTLNDDLSFAREQIAYADQDKARVQNKADELDAANNVLRSHLRAAEDRAAELEGQIHLLTQEKLLFGDAFEKRKIEFDNTIQDKARRIRELENQLNAAKKQLADAESSNLLKDDVISSALNKQSSLTEDSRALRIKIDSLVSDNNNLLQTTDELRNQLANATSELSSVRASYGELKGTVLAETTSRLLHAEELSRSQGLELELLKEDYAKLKGELTSVVEKLSATDRRNHTLQSNLAISEGEAQAAQTNNASLMDENARLRSQTEELAVKVATLTRELSATRVQLQERENDVELFSNRLKDTEDAFNAANNKNKTVEAIESDIANEMRLFGDQMTESAAAGVANVDHSHYDADYFASPLPVSHRHANGGNRSSPKDNNRFPMTPTTPFGSGAQSLGLVRQGFEDLKLKSEALLQHNHRLKEQLAASKREFNDQKKRLESAELELRASTAEAERLVAQLESAEDQLADARKEIAHVGDERAQIYSSADEFAQTIRTHVRNMDNAVADSIARVNAMMTGRVIIGADNNPILLSYHPPSPSSKQLVKGHSRSAVDFGASNLLATSVAEVERAMTFLCGSLEAVVVDAAQKKQLADRTDLSIIDKERAWAKERTAFLDRIAAIESDFEAERRNKMEAEAEATEFSKQIDSLKILLGEFSNQKDELEGECRAAMSNSESLQAALTDAEAVCLDLRGRLKAAQTDNEAKVDEINSLMLQLDSSRKRVAEAEMSIEKLSANQARLRSEKEAMDGVRKSLEAELDRARAEVGNLKLQFQAAEEDSKSTFEAEKLLAALTTTLDQVSSLFGSLTSSVSIQSKSSASSPTALVKAEGSLNHRVDTAVRRLGDLRGWARDECRNRRAMEDRLETMEQDLQSTTHTNESLQEQLKRVMQSASEKGHECREKSKEISELQGNILRKQEDLDKLRREMQSAQLVLDEEKKGRIKLMADIQLKESEFARLHMELDSTKAALSRTAEQLSNTRDRLAEVSAEAEQRNEQLKATKANNARLSASLELLEKGVDRDRSDRGLLEQKLIDSESYAVVSMRLKSQVADLESSLHSTRDILRQVTESKDIAEHQVHALQLELDSIKSSLRSAESRLEQSQRERISLQEEGHASRVALNKLQQQLEQEQANRMRAEANVDALKRGSAARSSEQDFAALVGDVEDKIFMTEQERSSLHNENHSLRLALEDKENQRSAEEARASKLEREVQLLKSKLNMTSQEIVASNSRAQALRTEGRRARAQVLEAVQQMWEAIDIVRADARIVGVELHTPMKPAGGSRLGEEESAVLGLEEALAVPELVEALVSFRPIVDFIRDIPRNRLELETAIKRAEQEKGRLQKELANTESRCEERVQRLREEIASLQGQLSELRKADSLRNAGSKQSSSLEGLLKSERDDKEKALGLVTKLKEECDLLTRDLHAAKRDLAAQRAQSISHLPHSPEGRIEAEGLRADLMGLRKELQAVNHHRNVLRDTVEQLEKQLRAKTEALADLQGQDLMLTHNKESYLHMQFANNSKEDSPGASSQRQGRSSRHSTAEDDEHVRKQAMRFRAKALAMEELAAIYRAGVIALYPDGASYSAAQFGQLSSGDGLGVGWIERELSDVRRSYEEEIKHLDVEVTELRAQLKQSVFYISELRKRFEENMRTFYKANRSVGTDGLMVQYEHVSLALEKVELENQDLAHELSAEKQEGRRRHAALVDDLVKALQARDAALSAVKRLELLCIDAGLQQVSIYEGLRQEVELTSSLRVHESVAARHSSTAGKLFDETHSHGERKTAGSAAGSHRKKDKSDRESKLDRLREKEREVEREKEESQRELQQHYRSQQAIAAAAAAGAQPSGRPHLSARALQSLAASTSLSQTALNALNLSGSFTAAAAGGSGSSKPTSPSDANLHGYGHLSHQQQQSQRPFVVRHLTADVSAAAIAATTPMQQQPSPPAANTLRQAQGGAAGGSSRHSSPSGLSSHLHSTTSMSSVTHTTANTNAAVVGGHGRSALASGFARTAPPTATSSVIRPNNTSPPTSLIRRPESATAAPTWQHREPTTGGGGGAGGGGGDGIIISHRNLTTNVPSSTRSSSRPKY